MRKKQFIKRTGFAVLYLLITSFITAMPENDTPNPALQSIAPAKAEPHIVFLITEDPLNYEAHNTIPLFARLLEKQEGYKVTVLLGKGPQGACVYPDFDIINKADLLVIFARRIALPHEQMKQLKSYIASGRPVVGIRTANHAFTAREKIAEGFEDWPEFVSSVLGCENRGYGPVEPGTDVTVNTNAANHPILKGLPAQWHSEGNVYRVAPLLDSSITVLLTGKVNNITEPVAWVRHAGASKVFYTSLGYPSDFQTSHFRKLMLGGIKWALAK